MRHRHHRQSTEPCISSHARRALAPFPSSVATTVVPWRQRPRPDSERGKGDSLIEFPANDHSFCPIQSHPTATATASNSSSNLCTKGHRRLRRARRPPFRLPPSHLGALRCLPIHAATWRGRQSLRLRLGHAVHAGMPPPRLHVVVGHVLLVGRGR